MNTQNPPVPDHPAPVPQPQHLQRQHQIPIPPIGEQNPDHQARIILDFGRLDSDYHIQDIAVQISIQDSLPTVTYQQLVQLTTMDLPITLAQFVRMWKTLILKRVQDVYENEKRVRSEHYIRLHRNILVPATLGDLLYQIGAFHSPSNGIVYHLTPPLRPANPPSWWIIDDNILAGWIQLTIRFRDIFTMKEFPSPADYEGRAMLMTTITDEGDTRRIKSLTNDPRPVDAFIRFMNDELYDPVPVAANAHLVITECLNLASIRASYVGKYCTGSRA